MQLNTLSISCLRNLQSVDLRLNSHFNIFFGENGGGKTSLLEAIHVLTTGRSFRAQKPRQIITFGEKSCTIAGTISEKDTNPEVGLMRLGVERFQTGGIKIRLAEQDCHSIALLAKALPIQLINSDSYDILEAAPSYRRQFLDWAMFHVEHSFYAVWQRFKRALQQRNAALKGDKRAFPDSIRIWDKELIETGALLDLQRKTLLTEFIPIFSEIVTELLKLEKPIEVQYQSGWDPDLSFGEALDRSFERDKAWGYTTLGPQRADLEFLIGEGLAKNILSRGQSKLFICALLMARATLLHRRHGRHSVFLIDDLNSELDQGASELLVRALAKLRSQVLITGIEAGPLEKLLENQSATFFTVREGQITPTVG